MCRFMTLVFAATIFCFGCGCEKRELPVRGSDSTATAKVTAVGDWTEPVNGLQFKVDIDNGNRWQHSPIQLKMSIRNTSKAEIAVLDPSKLPAPEQSLAYRASLFNMEMTKDYTRRYALEPIYKAEWYTFLAPGQVISGKLEVANNAPRGTCLLYITPYMIKPREDSEKPEWSAKDWQRIHPIAWTNWNEYRAGGKQRPSIGPIEIEIRAAKGVEKNWRNLPKAE